jgi:DNA-binding PadR family transcriptional regulator
VSPQEKNNVSSRDLMAGFVRLHVLNHAKSGPIFGIGIIERLAFHGYVLSPGTLYPILHGLERDGFLSSREETEGNRRRRIYAITDSGSRMLILSKVRLWELFKEVFEKELSPDTAGHVERALRIAVSRVASAAGPGRPAEKPPRRPRRGRTRKQ